MSDSVSSLKPLTEADVESGGELGAGAGDGDESRSGEGERESESDSEGEFGDEMEAERPRGGV